jgi:GH35 family endo-1,4-beta-xylanase
MDSIGLTISAPIKGGYFSSEQIDLLSIIQCNTIEELDLFIENCDQINKVPNILEQVSGIDLEKAKRRVFRIYQDTIVYHDEGIDASRLNRLRYLGLSSQEELMTVLDHTHPHSEEILSLNHHFVSEERDQLKADDLYDEMVELNEHLYEFNNMLIGSGKIYNVVNRYETDSTKKFDFYHAKRDLEFARKNGKQVRYHSLLVKDDSKLFEGKNKEQILALIKEYVNESIKFIKDYNATGKIFRNDQAIPVINGVDLFNEIVSFKEMVFDKEEQKWYECVQQDGVYKVFIDSEKEIYRDLRKGEVPAYQNIWEVKYGISMEELMSCFKEVMTNKPHGVSFVYNEPFLENEKRRKKVFEILKQIPKGFVDTLGTQMHITLGQSLDEIRECFADLKELQDTTGIKIQITEFDMSLNRGDVKKVFGSHPQVSLEQVYEHKKERMAEISKIIQESGVVLSGVSYWSLTDGIDWNLERIRSEALKNQEIDDVTEIPSAFGGLIPTHKSLIEKYGAPESGLSM